MANPKPIIIVDTSDDADALFRFMPGIEVAVKTGDIDGRPVIVWMDDPWPYAAYAWGRATVIKVLQWDSPALYFSKTRDIYEVGADIKTVEPITEKDLPDQISDVPLPEEPPPVDEEPVSKKTKKKKETTKKETANIPSDWQELAPFKMLGHSNGKHYFMVKETGQVTSISGSQLLIKNQLVTIASLQWWQRTFKIHKKDDWDLAGNAMLRASAKKGIYDTEDIRGRGVWEDEGRSVLHLGSHLIVDGEPCDVYEIKSEYSYPLAAALDKNFTGKPVTKKDAHRFYELCEMLTWKKPIYARLLAGWCVIAPLCGGLKWRPHLWLTGTAGSGKTTVLTDIVNEIIGDKWKVFFASNTTEPGVRQRLGSDARPGMFDEIDPSTKDGPQRIQKIIELLRMSSSETGAEIVMGGQDGKAVIYKIRSCFILSSINVSLRGFADHSRITPIQLIKDPSPDIDEKYEYLKKVMGELLTPEFCAGFRARNILLLPVIRKNAETFARAGSRHLGSRRTGDQIGTMLAGAYSMFSEKEITLDEAIKYLEHEEWEGIVETSSMSDEQNCLDRILEAIVRVEGAESNHDISIGEAISLAAGDRTESEYPRQKMVDALARYGLMVRREILSVAAPHAALRKILQDTPWQDSYQQILERIPGAENIKNARTFANNVRKRGVDIPLNFVIGEGQEEMDYGD